MTQDNQPKTAMKKGSLSKRDATLNINNIRPTFSNIRVTLKVRLNSQFHEYIVSDGMLLRDFKNERLSVPEDMIMLRN